jgi:hypothetical protein
MLRFMSCRIIEPEFKSNTNIQFKFIYHSTFASHDTLVAGVR